MTEPPAIPPRLVDELREAERVVVLTGAGISAESGVPTFREAQSGHWARFNPEELASVAGFRANPARVSRWYAERRAQALTVEPNAGHLAIAELGRRVPRFTLITQNIDGLHQRAGSAEVLELHGNLRRLKRLSDGRVVDRYDASQCPPRCPDTGDLLRPDVVWFGELLPPAAIQAAIVATRGCELFLSVGTSSQVYPAAALPVEALECGAALVEINPEPTPLTAEATYVLAGPAGVVLPALVRAAWPA